MTENDKPPTDTNLINLPIRGIWTTDKVDGRGVPVDRGTFMISRKNFWGNYLLPLLKKYNGVMETICGRPDVYVKIDGFGLWWRWSCGWRYVPIPRRVVVCEVYYLFHTERNIFSMSPNMSLTNHYQHR